MSSFHIVAEDGQSIVGTDEVGELYIGGIKWMRGYWARKALADDGLVIDESTLYPLLRRLETQGLLASEWREEEKRNKRFYRLTTEGEQMFAQLLAEWQAINASVTATLGDHTGNAQ